MGATGSTGATGAQGLGYYREWHLDSISTTQSIGDIVTMGHTTNYYPWFTGDYVYMIDLTPGSSLVYYGQLTMVWNVNLDWVFTAVSYTHLTLPTKRIV